MPFLAHCAFLFLRPGSARAHGRCRRPVKMSTATLVTAQEIPKENFAEVEANEKIQQATVKCHEKEHEDFGSAPHIEISNSSCSSNPTFAPSFSSATKRTRGVHYPEAKEELVQRLSELQLDPNAMTWTQWSQVAWDLNLPLDPRACCKRVTGSITTAFRASLVCDNSACHDPMSPDTGYVRCIAGAEWSDEDSVRLHRKLDSLAIETRLLSKPEWDSIASDLKLGRSGTCCARHALHWRAKKQYNSFHCNLDSRPWTESDIAMMRSAVENFGNKWTLISMHMRRSVYECMRKWHRLQNSGPWSRDELERLYQALEIFNPKQASKIAAHVRTRSASQCQIRIMNEMTSMTPWSKEKDQYLLNAVQKHGCNWSKVVQHLREEHGMEDCFSHSVVLRYRNLMKTNVKFKWDMQAQDRLKWAVKYMGTKNWKMVAEYVTGDSALFWRCKSYYEKHYDPRFYRGPWTESEKQQLYDIVSSIQLDGLVTRYNWREIAAKLGTRRHPELVWHPLASLRKGQRKLQIAKGGLELSKRLIDSNHCDQHKETAEIEATRDSMQGSK